MNAGAANLMTCQSGKFQGITANTGPIGVLGVVAQHAHTLGHLVTGLDDGLSHLEGHHLGDRRPVRLEHVGHGAHQRRALVEPGPAIDAESTVCKGEPPLDLRLVVGLEGLQSLARSGVHR
jgi:hypothetical protein